MGRPKAWLTRSTWSVSCHRGVSSQHFLKFVVMGVNFTDIAHIMLPRPRQRTMLDEGDDIGALKRPITPMEDVHALCLLPKLDRQGWPVATS